MMKSESFSRSNGDFDGNGRTDFAVLIEENNRSHKRASIEMRKARLVVFLTKAAGFQTKVFDPEGAYLVLMKRGDWDYSYETDQYFTYQNDAIFAGIFEKGGTSYRYQKGRLDPLSRVTSLSLDLVGNNSSHAMPALGGLFLSY